MTMQHPRPIHWVLLAVLSIAWGFAFYLIAIGLESFPPLTLVTLRLGVGAMTLYLIMRWQGLALPGAGQWWWRYMLLAICGNLVPFTLIAWGETRITSSQTGLLMALMPISTMVLSHFFLEDDPLTPRRLSGVLLGLVGVIVLIGGDLLSGPDGAQLVAQLAVLTATLSYAVNAVYTKRITPGNTLVVATGTLIVGTAMLLPVTLYLERPWLLQPDTGPVLATLLLGVASTGLATWIYFRVVSDCGPAFLSIINYIIPCLAFGAGVLLLGEPAVFSQFLGLAAICFGIALIQNRAPRASVIE